MPPIRCFRISAKAANQSIEDGIALATILASADRTTAPRALLIYEQLRRERVAQVQRGARQSGLRYDSAYSDLGVRDAEITAHAAFRRRLYDHDVVPEAKAAAAARWGGDFPRLTKFCIVNPMASIVKT